MPRTPRRNLPDGAFHAILHAVANERLFWDDLDRRVFLGLLQQTIERHGWRVLTFVLMDTHLHMLVVAAARDLSPGFWWLDWQYAEHVRRRRLPGRGHVFESRPKTPPVTTERHLFAVLRYIANNPVKAGMSSRAEDYRWSAHRAILGQSSPMPLLAIDEVLGHFASDPDTARERYQTFVSGEDPPGHTDVRRWAEGQRWDRPTLTEVLAGSESLDAVRAAHVECGYSLRAIAAELGVSHTTLSRRLERAA